MKKQNTAFSLTELILVIMGVCVLSALLLAAVQKARLMAEDARCISHLRQIGAASHEYAFDHRNKLPGPMVAVMVATYSAATPNHLAAYLYPYFHLPPKPPGVPDYRAEVFECPAIRRTTLAQGALPAGIRYFFSPRNYTRTDGKLYHPFGYQNSSTKIPEPPLSLTEVDAPSKVTLLIDADQQLVTDYRGNINMAAKPAHRNKRHHLFMDVHVEVLPANP